MWEHVKQLLDSNYLTEVICVIPQSRYHGFGDKGESKPWAKEIRSRRKKEERLRHSFILPNGERHPDGEINVWLVHL